MRILLVEDDTMIGPALKKGLGMNGYAAEWVATGGDAIHSLEGGGFDLVILDIHLPDMSGLDILKSIRANKSLADIPVILLTANDGTENKVKGLDSGADDYMTKPFDIKELAARVRALARRNGAHSDSGNILRARGIELDMATSTIKKGDATFVPTASEIKVLALLLERPGRLVSKVQMEEALYGWEGDIDSNTVEVIIYNLRKKLGRDAIRTMRGIGYMVQP